MLSSIIDGILESSDEEEGSEEEDGGSEGDEEEEEAGSSGEEEEEEEEEEAGSSEEEEEEGDAAAAAAPADPFGRKQLQAKAAAAPGQAMALQQRPRAEPEAGATVFIRGLPLDVSKEQVFLKMKVGLRGGRGGEDATRALPVAGRLPAKRCPARVPHLLPRHHPLHPCRPTALCARAAWWLTRPRASSRALRLWTSTSWPRRRQHQRRAPRAGAAGGLRLRA